MNIDSSITSFSTGIDSSEPLEATLERRLEQQLKSYGVMFRQDGLPEFPDDQFL